MKKIIAVSLLLSATSALAQNYSTTTITTEKRQYQTKTVRDGGLRQTEMDLLRKSDPKSSANDMYKAKQELDRVLRLNDAPATRTETRIEVDRD